MYLFCFRLLSSGVIWLYLQVSQSYGAFNHILGDLSLIVNQFESLSAFSAGIDRLGEFLERMSGMSEYHTVVTRSQRRELIVEVPREDGHDGE